MPTWLVPTWLVFEFLPTKLSHYVLPAYPALALLCGYGVWQLANGARYPVSRLIRIAYGPFQLGKLPKNAVEEVPQRVLADQLGFERKRENRRRQT